MCNHLRHNRLRASWLELNQRQLTMTSLYILAWAFLRLVIISTYLQISKQLKHDIDKPKVISRSQSKKLTTQFSLKSQCPTIVPKGQKKVPNRGPKCDRIKNKKIGLYFQNKVLEHDPNSKNNSDRVQKSLQLWPN